MDKNSKIPSNWTHENDEDLANLIKDHVIIDTSGCIRNLIKNVTFSSQRVRRVFQYFKLIF